MLSTRMKPTRSASDAACSKLNPFYTRSNEDISTELICTQILIPILHTAYVRTVKNILNIF
jgi:hypothetical protein